MECWRVCGVKREGGDLRSIGKSEAWGSVCANAKEAFYQFSTVIKTLLSGDIKRGFPFAVF